MKERRSALVVPVPTVNYHVLRQCNMRCGFCFATYTDIAFAEQLDEASTLSLVDRLAEAGAEKINFAGGEPMLLRWIPTLIRRAKDCGLDTSIVTNGSRIDDAWLDDLACSLDIIALSIDSVDLDTLRKIGRAVPNRPPMSESDYLRMGAAIKRRGIRLKVNTVVNRHNRHEDFRQFIEAIAPERWKIFQALPVEGQNHERINEFMVTPDEFQGYVDRNRSVERDGVSVVPEDNEMMTGSYLMVDPLGRFFDNTRGRHAYSRSILEIGVAQALKDVKVYPGRFEERGGRYK